MNGLPGKGYVMAAGSDRATLYHRCFHPHYGMLQCNDQHGGEQRHIPAFRRVGNQTLDSFYADDVVIFVSPVAQDLVNLPQGDRVGDELFQKPSLPCTLFYGTY